MPVCPTPLILPLSIDVKTLNLFSNYVNVFEIKKKIAFSDYQAGEELIFLRQMIFDVYQNSFIGVDCDPIGHIFPTIMIKK